MTRFLALTLAAIVFAGHTFSAQADTNSDPVVIELFASQNCTACPKAHKTLKAVRAEHDDVLILTWSVDYWDYLGEPDPMAMPQASERQAIYTERMRLRAPYTPQSVYDGVMQCPATKRRQVETNIRNRLKAHTSTAPVISETGSSLEITGTAPDQPLDILLVEYLPDGAHTTDMINPIISSQIIGSWSGTRTAVDYTCANSCAVLLQEPGGGEIVTARALGSGA